MVLGASAANRPNEPSRSWGPGGSLSALIDARERAFGVIADSLRHKDERALHGRLSTARTQKEREVVGLVLARVIADEAVALESSERLDAALFRFAHHLRTSAGNPRQSRERQTALAQAAISCFESLDVVPRREVERLATLAIESTDQPDGLAFEAVLGMDWDDFKHRLREVKGIADVTRLPEEPSDPVPPWLTLSPREYEDPLLTSTRSWALAPASDPIGALAVPLHSGWAAYMQGDAEGAYQLLTPVLASVGTSWGPSLDVASRHTWNWLRLVVALHQRDASPHDRYRCILSALELAARLPAGASSSQSSLIEELLNGLSFDDPDSLRSWAVLTARAAIGSGHELLVADMSNHDRASMRRAWFGQFQTFGLDEAGMTADMVATIGRELNGLRSRGQELRSESGRSKLLQGANALLSRLRVFCDSAEDDLAERVALPFRQANALLTSSDQDPRLGRISVAIDDLERAETSIRLSGTLLLQEVLLPLVSRVRGLLRDLEGAVEARARPEIELEVLTKVLPLQAKADHEFEVRIRCRNVGAETARSVVVSIEAESLNLTQSVVAVGDMPRGSQREAVCRALSGSGGPAVPITARARWTDDFDRDRELIVTEVAESQRPSAWSRADVNPFRLQVLDDPARLVGRQLALSQLIPLVRAGESIMVTGHKRVGKTSLVRVLLRQLRELGHPTAFLPLGRALGGEARACDLVLGMLEELAEAIQRSHPDWEVVEPDAEAIEANFAHGANKWFRKLETATHQEGVHPTAILAIDDFDELPVELTEGSKGDALFRYLRTMVDVRWLSLLFIGSEVLPKLINSHGFRLNAVTEFLVDQFQNRDDTQLLLERPTSERLDWSASAIDAVHHIAAGNPYFSTLIAQDLWQVLRDADRTYVQEFDVDRSVDRMSRHADGRHFVHFWADDPEGMRPDSNHARYCAAVLRSIAVTSRDPSQPIAPTEFRDLVRVYFPAAEEPYIGVAVSSLRHRRVLLGDESQVRFALPLLGRWLAGAGGSYLDTSYPVEHAVSVARYTVPAAMYVELAEGLFYCGEQINEIRIRSWLEQVDSPRKRWLLLALLRRLVAEGYYSPNRIGQELLPQLVTSVKDTSAGARQRLDKHGYMTNWYVYDYAESGRSGKGVARNVAGALKIRKTSNVLVLKDLIERIQVERADSVILVADDFIGTGNTMKAELQVLIDGLDAEAVNWRDRTTLVVGAYLISDASVVESLQKLGSEVAFGATVAHRLQAFDPEANVFESEGDLFEAKALVEGVGLHLVRDNPLGYGAKGLLLCLPDNCPNNTLPVFWQAGKDKERPWRPLFPRRL